MQLTVCAEGGMLVVLGKWDEEECRGQGGAATSISLPLWMSWTTLRFFSSYLGP